MPLPENPSLFDDVCDLGQMFDDDAPLPTILDQQAQEQISLDEFAGTSTDSRIEIRFSARRKRSVSALREGDRIIVNAPKSISKTELDSIVTELVAKLDLRQAMSASHDELEKRARQLSIKYLHLDLFETHPKGVTVRWVSNQNSRWGSCTPATGTIRISHRLQKAPQYVIDAVVFHELIHLLEANHGPRFQVLMESFPKHKLAQEFLRGYSLGEQNK